VDQEDSSKGYSAVRLVGEPIFDFTYCHSTGNYTFSNLQPCPQIRNHIAEFLPAEIFFEAFGHQ